METLAAVRDRIRLRLQDPQASLWTNAELKQYINLACLDLQQQTQWMEDWSGALVSSGTADYARDTDKIQNMRWQEYDRERLDAIDIYELDKFKPDWRNEAQNIPVRTYRSDWDTDTLWPTPNTAGDTFTFSQETGIIVAIQDSLNAYIATLDAELGAILAMRDTTTPDDFFQVRIQYADRNTDSLGIFTMIVSPYGNLRSVFSRLPDALANDWDHVPFPDWAHYALEEYVIGMALHKEGDANNPVLGEAHLRFYRELWVPFVLRMVNSRTPDHPIIWRGQDPNNPAPANYSAATPSYRQ